MATKISNEYKQTAIEGMSLHITEDEMFVLIPSERGNNAYRMWMDEATMQPTSCNCPGHKRWGTACKHMQIVADAFAGYVAPVVATPVVELAATPVAEEAPAEEPRITEVEAGSWYVVNRNTQVWRDAESGKWFAIGPTANALEIVLDYLEKQKAVAEAEQIVARPPVQEAPVKPVLKRDMFNASLTSNLGFSLLKV